MDKEILFWIKQPQVAAIRVTPKLEHLPSRILLLAFWG
ncbi:hypothetical protein ACP4OV_006548 [Aristida adscensionis]